MTEPTREIVVVGLGPGDARLLTVETAELLKGDRVFLRTRVHPTVESIAESRQWPSFDHFYDESETFDGVYQRIVDSLMAEAQRGSLVYAVPGHPLFGEATVRRLLELAADNDIVVRIVPAVSFLDSLVVVLGLDPLTTNLQLVDALDLVAVTDLQPYAGGKMPISPLRPAIVAQIYSTVVASGAKLALLQIYPAEFEVTLLSATGSAKPRVKRLPLHELDREPVDHLSSLYLPATDPLIANRVPEGLQQIVARLRAPGGCPWDREQTHESLTRHMLEEAYEVIHAIEGGSRVDLAEELGDVLLQVYLHSQVAEEAGQFALEDVIQLLSDKLVRRHPHVFGDRVIASSGEVVKAWDQIKQDERAQRESTDATSPYSSIPPSLPALSRAQTVLRRARTRGMDNDIEHSLAVDDYRAESDAGEAAIASQLARIVAEAERVGVDAEQALRQWTTAFVQRAGDARTPGSA